MEAGQDSQQSADWGLSSLWRPPSQHSYAESTRGSLQDGFAPHWSLAMPSTFFKRLSSSRKPYDEEAANSNGTASLIASPRASRHRSNTIQTEDSQLSSLAPMPVRPTREARGSSLKTPKEEAFARLVRLRTAAPRHSNITSPVRTMSSVPELRVDTDSYVPPRYSESSVRTRSEKRQSLRKTSKLIAELPALPAPPKTPGEKVVSTPDTMDGTTVFASPDRRKTTALPIPPEPIRQSVQDGDPHLVLWNGPRDRGNALNWSRGKKWVSTFLLGSLTFCVTFASSATSSAAVPATAEFGGSPDVFVLSTTLYMIGIAVGTVLWSPLNELYGRQMPLYIGMVAFAICQIPVAAAQNLATIFIFRFLAGVFGCAPIITVIGSTCDLWSTLDRGVGLSVFSTALVAGPAAGPFLGSLITVNTALGWRWTSWISFIFCVFFGICSWIFHSETAGSILLKRRAKQLRYSTRDWALHAPTEEHEFNWQIYIDKHVWKPLVMLFTEPILLLMTLYMSYAYGVLYLVVDIMPLSYISARHWSPGKAGLPLMAVIGGVLIGCVINLAFAIKRQAPMARKYGRLFPEERLLPMIIGGVLFTFGIFLYSLTSNPHLTTPIPEIVAGIPLGIGIHLITLQGTNYLLDVYTLHAGAAIAVNTAIRSLFAAAFFSFAKSLFQNLQPRFAGVLLGVIALAFIPLPILFFKFGVKIRAASAFTVKLPSGSGDSPVEGGPEWKR